MEQRGTCVNCGDEAYDVAGLALRARLDRDEVVAQHLVGKLLDLLGGGGHLNTALKS